MGKKIKYIIFIFLIFISTGCFNKTIMFKIRPSSYPNYSNDGKSILFAPIVKNVQRLILYNRVDKSAVWIKTSLPKSDNCNHPVFSKDGKKIAFVWVNKKKKTSEICLINIDGTGFKQVTKANHHSMVPFFSYDGKKIYFLRSLKQKKRKGVWLYSINIDGTEEKRISDEYYFIHNPSCTSDGNSIIFSIDYGHKEDDGKKYYDYKIVKFDIETSNLFTLLDNKKTLVPISANNENKIYYIGDSLSYKKTDEMVKKKEYSLIFSGVYLMDIKGKNSKLIEKIIFDTYFLNISPDDKKLLYIDVGNIKEFDIDKKTSEMIIFDENVIINSVK